MQMFADLLNKLDNTLDVDGDNMLDTSMVLAQSFHGSTLAYKSSNDLLVTLGMPKWDDG